MAQNYICRGEVITLTADKYHQSGKPYRVSNFNGVALITVNNTEQLPFQLEGVFEFSLAGVNVGDAIYIDGEDELHCPSCRCADDHLFGRAVTGTDAEGKFYCRLLQS